VGGFKLFAVFFKFKGQKVELNFVISDKNAAIFYLFSLPRGHKVLLISYLKTNQKFNPSVLCWINFYEKI
jgi:hypothetical protein